MNFQSTMLTEISQTEKDKYHMISLICGILKRKQTEQNKTQTHRYREQIDGCQRAGWWRMSKIGKED